MNTAYKEYARLAYRRTVLSAMQRYLAEFLPSEVPAARTLQCEEVMVLDRDVPDDAFHDYLDELRMEEASVRASMAQFEFTRKAPRGKPEDTKSDEEQQEGSNPRVSDG